MKKIVNSVFIPNCFLLLLCYLFLFPTEAFGAACSGLDLWFHTLLPSLLPFCVLSNLLIASGIIPKILNPLAPIFQRILGLSVYGTYAFLLGLLCGYPMGAKLVSDLYQKHNIDYQEGRYLLTFVNHASPMFITTYISLYLFGNTDTLPKTFFILYSSALLTSVFFRILYHYSKKEQALPILSATAIPEELSPITIDAVDEAIFNGFETITKLGGYIILFSIFSSMLQQIRTPFLFLQWFLPAVTELTTGIYQITQTNLNFEMQYRMILTFTSFGGISTIAQTKGMLRGTPFQISTYIIGKIVNALCTFTLTLLL